MILSLPTEMHAEIMAYLPFRDLKTMTLVCKTLNPVATNALLADIGIWDNATLAAVHGKLSRQTINRAVKAISVMVPRLPGQLLASLAALQQITLLVNLPEIDGSPVPFMLALRQACPHLKTVRMVDICSSSSFNGSSEQGCQPDSDYPTGLRSISVLHMYSPESSKINIWL